MSYATYGCLIKASWILSDVITKHPQQNLLEAAIRYDVQALAEVCHPRILLTQIPGEITNAILGG